MANKHVFTSPSNSRVANLQRVGRMIRSLPAANAVNEAGGSAYEYASKHKLAQFAATGCLNDTFYGTAEDQLDTVLELCKKLSPTFVAKVAVFARERGYMKDMPALLCAILAADNTELASKIFGRVIDNPKMLANFVQITRSGRTGRSSLSRASRRMIEKWLDGRSDEQVFKASAGITPSLADILKLSHPRPKTSSRDALYGYLLGKEFRARDLPTIARQYEDYKKGESKKVPDVPFQMLTSLSLGKAEWTEIARNASWKMTRMNLNTFKRHGVFEDQKMVRLVADRLRDPEQVRNSRMFPYQLLVAYMNTTDVPNEIRNALQDAMEVACENIPEIKGNIFLFPDLSGSMNASVTGEREGSTSVANCRDVAGLVCASFLRRNDGAVVIPFAEKTFPVNLNPRDSVMTNSVKIEQSGEGGTKCSCALAEVNRRNAHVDLVIYCSDNESWIDSAHEGPGPGRVGNGATDTMREWAKVKARCPKAKMVCLDLAANSTTQAAERPDVLNLGGFSDQVYEQIAQFVTSGKKESWVEEIEKIDLDQE